MLRWKNVVGLSVGEEEVAGKVEAYIDAAILEQVTKDEKKRSFSINRAELVKAAGVDVLSLKVKAHVLGKYIKDGWVLSENQHVFILTAPMPKRGGRPKGSKNAVATTVTTTVQPPVAPENAPEATAENAPTEPSPAATVTA